MTRRPPPRISLSSINPNNLGTLRKLNSVLFPIKYAEKFYADVLLPEAEDYCKLVYYNDIPVGTICARIEKGDSEAESKLYIMTMGVLAPYRSRSLGTQAIKHVQQAALSSSQPFSATPTSATTPAKTKLSHIYLHVQVSNHDAKRFYEKHGFKEVGIVEGYYKKIEPRDAWILEWKCLDSQNQGEGEGVSEGEGKMGEESNNEGEV